MDFGTINWLAVALSGLACMASGAVWYSPKTFFPVWWKAVGRGEERPGMAGMGLVWGLTALSSLWQPLAFALVLPVLTPALGGFNALGGMLAGLVLWGGFIAPTCLVNKLFAGHGLKTWAIEAGNHLVNFVVFGAIIGAWH
jgi:hypothetical protein